MTDEQHEPGIWNNADSVDARDAARCHIYVPGLFAVCAQLVGAIAQ